VRDIAAYALSTRWALLGRDCVLQDLGMSSQYLFQFVQPLFKLSAVPGPQPRFLPLFVLAQRSVPGAPTARRLSSVTFHLDRFSRCTYICRTPRGCELDAPCVVYRVRTCSNDVSLGFGLEA